MTHRHHDATVRQHQAHDPHQSLTGCDSVTIPTSRASRHHDDNSGSITGDQAVPLTLS